ncbi:MAG: exodeoxyribonuclease V subunit alpha [Myxococcales bacterium]|nr:exodeoxyribonuclease V subunit alpha [Myxococcales bacterium]
MVKAPLSPFEAALAGYELDGASVTLACELARLEPEDTDQPAAACLALAVLLAQRSGHTRQPLSEQAVRQAIFGAREHGLPAAVNAAIAAAVAYATRAQRTLVSHEGASARRPFVVAGGYLYAQRNHWLEASLGARLLQQRQRADRDGTLDATSPAWQAIIRGGEFALSDEQAAAVALALRRPLLAISGGPGTGKTAIITAMLRTWAANGVSRVALAAPTGKAANRMQTVIAAQLARLSPRLASDELLCEQPPAAQTLHRLLGFQVARQTFRHGEDEPLPYDLVVVDEASMIDGVMMERLVRSLGDTTSLVLLGDVDQLPSVGAGRCFADICRWGAQVAAASAGESPLVVSLTKSFRMNPADPHGSQVYRAAQAIRSGNAGAIADLPQRKIAELAWAGAEWVQTSDDTAPALAACDAWWMRLQASFSGLVGLARREYAYDAAAWGDGDVAALTSLFAGLDGSRILTATRGGALGALSINARLHERMRLLTTSPGGEPWGAQRAAEFLPGEPVLFATNNYELGLYNGDAGVVVRVRDGSGEQRYAAVFPVGDAYVPFALDAVRGHMELDWALTTHKAQGSEYDGIMLVLPAEPSPVATRELVYTALTRARRSAVIVATPDALSRALAQATSRETGLLAAIEASCPHELLLNGACVACGSTSIDPVAASNKPVTLIAPQTLVRRR